MVCRVYDKHPSMLQPRGVIAKMPPSSGGLAPPIPVHQVPDLRCGTLIALGSAFFYATGLIFFRYAHQGGVTTGSAAMLRFTIAALILIPALLVTRRWVRLPAGQAIRLFLMGFVGYSTLCLTWFFALTLTPAWLVSLLTALLPLTVNLTSWIAYGERPALQQMAALASVLVGAMILFWQPLGIVNWGGVFLMLFNVAVNTAYVTLGQRITRNTPAQMSTAWMVIGTACGTTVYTLMAGQFDLGFSAPGWLWMSLNAVVSTILAMIAVWWAIGRIGAARVSVIGTSEIVFSILMAVLILGESLSPNQVLGGVLILAGAVWVQLPRRCDTWRSVSPSA